MSRWGCLDAYDEAAVLSCMVYVDLNPVRARITEKLEESQHTSIKKRLDELPPMDNNNQLETEIEAVAGEINEKKLPIKLKEYIDLVEWTGISIIHPDKASIPSHIAPILDRLNLQQNHWLKQIENLGTNYCRAIGPIEKIRAKAKLLEVRCLHGIEAAKQMFVCPS